MSGPDSPLQIIRQKEMDLRQQIETARQQAEARIRAARADAEQIVWRADQAGRAEAAAHHQEGIKQAHQEATAITNAAIEEASVLRRLAAVRLDEVAKHIMEWVYAPFDGESADHRDEIMPG